VREWLRGTAPSLAGDERLETQLTRLDRHFMAPSTAVDWINVEGEVDVTAVLPTLRCPTLLIDHEGSPTGAAECRHVQTLIPGAELVLIPGDPNGMVFSDRAAIADGIEAFVVRDPKAVASDTVLGSVLFTDIVGSTERQASMGDRAWVELVRGHHTIVVTRSSDGEASRTTQQATASTRPSTDPLVPYAARWTSSNG
jgi:hypothetical protein